jgi:hypothetical protein
MCKRGQVSYELSSAASWFYADDALWDVTVFTKNREGLLDGDVSVRSRPY